MMEVGDTMEVGDGYSNLDVGVLYKEISRD